jgi:WXG100 family type VII secretion target
MDVEQTRSVLSAMEKTNVQINDMYHAMSSKIVSLQASWKGPSATEFQNQYDQVKSQFMRPLLELAALQSLLGREIVQWEATGNKFG